MIDKGFTMAKEAHIRVNIATGKIKVTDEKGKTIRKMTTTKGTALKANRSVAAPAIFQLSESERKCVVIRIGGSEYRVCT